MGETKTGWLLGNVTSADLNFLQHRCPVLFPETYLPRCNPEQNLVTGQSTKQPEAPLWSLEPREEIGRLGGIEWGSSNNITQV